jgi:cell division protein FtsW
MDNRQPNRRIVSQSNARTVRPAEKKPPVQLLIRLRGGVDRPFLILVLILVCLGSIMVFSASFAYAGYKYDNPYYFVIRQSVWAVLGFSVMILTMQFDYRIYQKLTVPFFIISTILLCLVPFIGSVRNGAKRWIIIGPISVQPSEIMKLALVMLLALYISSNRDRMHTFRYGIMIPYVMIGGVMLITVIERHISATLILFLIGTIVIFIGGAPTKILGGFAAIGATIMGGVVLFSSYAKERVEFWLHPEEDPSDSGYQLLQSLYAIGSGGLMGLGLGRSRQKYLYLPEEHNDYIFPILCEELGFVGAMVVLVLFMLLIIRGYWIAMHARDRFGALMAAGLTTHLALQVFLNIGVVTNFLPATGISLPFFSYGGTALLIQLFEVGLILSVSRQNDNKLL